MVKAGKTHAYTNTYWKGNINVRKTARRKANHPT